MNAATLVLGLFTPFIIFASSNLPGTGSHITGDIEADIQKFFDALDQRNFEWATDLAKQASFPMSLAVSASILDAACEKEDVEIIRLLTSLNPGLVNSYRGRCVRMSAYSGKHKSLRALITVPGLNPNFGAFCNSFTSCAFREAIAHQHWKAAESLMLHPDLNLSNPETCKFCFDWADNQFYVILYADPRVDPASGPVDAHSSKFHLLNACKTGDSTISKIVAGSLSNDLLIALLRCSAGYGRLGLFESLLLEFRTRNSDSVLYELDYLMGYSAIFKKWDVMQSILSLPLPNYNDYTAKVKIYLKWAQDLDTQGFDNLAKFLLIYASHVAFMARFQNSQNMDVYDLSKLLLENQMSLWHDTV